MIGYCLPYLIPMNRLVLCCSHVSVPSFAICSIVLSFDLSSKGLPGPDGQYGLNGQPGNPVSMVLQCHCLLPSEMTGGVCYVPVYFKTSMDSRFQFVRIHYFQKFTAVP